MKKYGYIRPFCTIVSWRVVASTKQICTCKIEPDDYRQKITQDYDSGFIRMICFPLW
mgnify:CR=1 FL=1